MHNHFYALMSTLYVPNTPNELHPHTISQPRPVDAWKTNAYNRIMRISLIAAASLNNVIGRDNDLPWDIRDDLQFFRRTTAGKPVIMGRKNYEAIRDRIGGPLPKRPNIIVTRQPDYQAEGCAVYGSLEEALKKTNEQDGDEMFVIGGGQIYAEALEKGLVERMYLTRVQADVPGDVFFPEFDETEWDLVSEESHEADDNNEHPFVIQVWDKK